ANLLNNLGSLTQEQGQYPRARELLDEAITLYRATGDRQGAAYALGNLAELAHLQSDHQRARELFSEALPLLEELGDRGAIAVALEGAAAVASKQHQPRRAVRLFATAAALRETIGAPLSASEQESNDRGFAALRATLEDGAFAANWEAGRALSLVDAIRLARDEGPEAN
ncbi:MAG TPA: tetratricopeptide repeat protein, partial [Chloroflexota bacterium]|nr:tetratricopeptide repeat protein [Chloroflexota bacterium]